MTSCLQVAGKVIDSGSPPFFVIEEGQANQGDHEVALDMIKIAASTGADAIEFQVAIANDFYVAEHPMHTLYCTREFSCEQLKELATAAHDHGLAAFAMVLSERLVQDLVHMGFDMLTINGSDIDNPHILDAVASSGIPFMLSTTMASIIEIDRAVGFLKRQTKAAFGLLHGQHTMASGGMHGVPPSKVGLATIGFLRRRYCVPVGFVDHTSAKEVAAFAVASGAALVTKHLSPSTVWQGPDWRICLEPKDMKRCVKLARLAYETQGSPEKTLVEGEEEDREVMRRSIVAASDLPAGTILHSNHLLAKRPGEGMSPWFFDVLEGCKLRRSVQRDQLLSPEDLCDEGPVL